VSTDAQRQSPIALQLRGITKSFGRVVAVSDVSLDVRSGTVHALLGENGAGKSTLMRIACGLEAADRGDVILFGGVSRRGSVADAAAAGVGMVHQHLTLAPNLTTTENFALGRRGLYRRGRMNDLLARTSAETGLRIAPDVPVGELSLVEQQRLEIVKAVGQGARLLVLDEPTSILAPGEIDGLLQWVRSFVARGGTVIFVTHKLREALAVADDVTVLRRGTVAHAGSVKGETTDSLAAAIFGHSASVEEDSRPVQSGKGDPILSVAALDVADDRGVTRVRGATFTLNRGDIVGLAAVEGAGHRELMQAVAGLRAPRAGSARLPERIAVVPADRIRDAVIPEFTLIENIALHGAGTRRGLVNWPEMRRRTEVGIDRFGIVAASPAAAMRTLSGGNQQRLVLARELGDVVDLVVADNPTRGLDARATAFVLTELRAAARAGAAVLLHSSDLDELLAVATRVLVVHQGAVHEFSVDRDVVGRAMLGAA